MKKITLLFTLLLVAFSGSSVFAQFTQSQLVAEWLRAKVYTKEYLDAMPADHYGFKPTPEIRSFAMQALHLADANYLFSAMGSGKASPAGQTLSAHDTLQKTVAQTKEAVTSAVMDSYDFVIRVLQEMPPGQWQETIKFGKTDITRSGLFGKAFEHQTHHRGQMTIYLRLKGITPPGEKLF
jgi:uncharacterized damage-inducible protein DinB